jgi:hypothetical protein
MDVYLRMRDRFLLLDDMTDLRCSWVAVIGMAFLLV